jgi:hypothetical protein
VEDYLEFPIDISFKTLASPVGNGGGKFGSIL